LAASPKDVELRFFRAQLYRAEGRDSEAMNALLGLVRDNPSFAPAHAALGTLLADQDRVAQARRAFEIAVGLEPRNHEAQTGLGRLALAEGSWEAALVHLTVALEQFDDPYLRSDRSKAFFEIGARDKAFADMEAAVRLQPDDPYLALDHGRLLMRSGRFPEAVARFTGILEEEPGLTLVRFYRGLSRDQAGDRAGAIEDLEAVLREKPDYSAAQEPLAVLHLEAGNNARSSALFRGLWSSLKKNDRTLVLAAGALLLSAREADRVAGVRLAQDIQRLMDQEGPLYQVVRTYVDSRTSGNTLTAVQRLPKGSDRAQAQVMAAIFLVRDGQLATARELARSAQDVWGLETTEGRLAAYILEL
jgi:tetratricopeptide (TPR) repeat protein